MDDVAGLFLQTDRLVLRRFTPDDVDLLVELDSDPQVMHYITGGQLTSSEEIATDFLPAFLDYYRRYDGFGFWAAVQRSTGDFLGWFHLRPATNWATSNTPSPGRSGKCSVHRTASVVSTVMPESGTMSG